MSKLPIPTAERLVECGYLPEHARILPAIFKHLHSTPGQSAAAIGKSLGRPKDFVRRCLRAAELCCDATRRRPKGKEHIWFLGPEFATLGERKSPLPPAVAPFVLQDAPSEEFDQILHDAITPERTREASPRCARLRMLYRLMPADGRIVRSKLLAVSTLSDRQLERALSAGVELGIFNRFDHTRLPNPQPSEYSRNRAGVQALLKIKPNLGASAFKGLNYSQQTELERVDWEHEDVHVTLHKAHQLGSLIACICRMHGVGTKRHFMKELGWADTTLNLIVGIGERLQILSYAKRPGVSRKAIWTVNWERVTRLQQLPNNRRERLESQRCSLRGATVEPDNQQNGIGKLLARIQLSQTPLDTHHKLLCAKRLTLAIGDRYEDGIRSLAAKLSVTKRVIDEHYLPWAVEAGFVKKTAGRGYRRVVIERDTTTIAAMAGDLPPSLTNGRTHSNGKRAATKSAVAAPRISWNGQSGELRIGETIKRVAPQARSIRPVLDAFQLAGWPMKVASPFGKSDPQKHHDAIRAFNAYQLPIKLFSPGSGVDISRENREPPEEPPEPPDEPR